MSQTIRRFPWPLAILPLFELGCFAAACRALAGHPLLALALLGMAAVALCFAVHVFFHECIHFSAGRPLPRPFTWGASIMMGLPFDGYRVHHANHHQHGNGEQDFSSTWRFSGEKRTAYPRLAYVLGWPHQSIAAGKFMREHAGGSAGLSAPLARIPAQRTAILLALVGLLLISWRYGLLYLGLVYLGWAAVALQNYGQHDPSRSGEATTWAHPLYNKLLFNNGLHYEHHAHPERPWNALRPDARSPRIRAPHLLHPLLSNTRLEVTDA